MEPEFMKFGLNDEWDRSTLTDLIVRGFEQEIEAEEGFLGNTLLPDKDVSDWQIKVKTLSTEAMGIGQYKTRGATTPIAQFEPRETGVMVELVQLEEGYLIQEDQLTRMRSSDLEIRRKAFHDLIERGRGLQLRNTRLKEVMKWGAIKGSLTLAFADSDSSETLTFGMAGTHTPTSERNWYTASTSIIDDLWDTLFPLIEDDLGARPRHMIMNKSTYRNSFLGNTEIKALISSFNRRNVRPTVQDVLDLLEIESLTIFDGQYRSWDNEDRSTTTTKYIPDDWIVIRTGASVEGQPVADFANGPVLTGENGEIVRQGPIAEQIYDRMTRSMTLRVTASGMPRLHFPDAFVYARVDGS